MFSANIVVTLCCMIMVVANRPVEHHLQYVQGISLSAQGFCFVALTLLFPFYTVDAYTGNYCEEKVGCPYDDCAQKFGDNAVCKVTNYHYFSS